MTYIKNIVPLFGAIIGCIIFLWVVTEGMFDNKKDNQNK